MMQLTLTGVSSTSSIGSPICCNRNKYRLGTRWNWGVENWGESGITVSLTGVEATTGIGEDVKLG